MACELSDLSVGMRLRLWNGGCIGKIVAVDEHGAYVTYASQWDSKSWYPGYWTVNRFSRDNRAADVDTLWILEEPLNPLEVY